MKKHLRLLAWLLSLTMLCELLPFAAFAQSDVGEAAVSTLSTLLEQTNGTAVETGKCGDNLTYSLDDAGTLTISGTGAMYDFSSFGTQCPWDSTKIKKVIVGDGVTSIGDDAFLVKSSSLLTTVELPESVTSIGAYAFLNCNKLKNIILPNHLVSIGEYAFNFCTSLEAITIPASVTDFGKYAFDDCTQLSSITLSDGLATLGVSVFSDCISLTSITIPDSIHAIPDSTFANCTRLTSITLPDTLTEIGISAFNNTNLSWVFIPASITSIQKEAFLNCDSLTDIYYSGTKEQWASVVIESDNIPLTTATIHCIDDEDTPERTFEFKKDNLSFLNSPNYFFKGKELEYWIYAYNNPTVEKKDFPKRFKNVSDQYGRVHISQGKFDQLTRNLSPNVLSWFHLKLYESSRIWGGSCYGMTTTAAIHFMDPSRIPLSSLSSIGLSDSDLLYELPAPVDNTEVENLINYYYMSQLLPTRYKIFSTYLYNCAHDFEGTLNEIIQSLSKGIPVIANTANHSVLLVNIKGEYSDHYVLGVYDPNKEEEQTMTLYKTPYISDENEAYLKISYGKYDHLQFYILASDLSLVDVRNYFDPTSDNETSTDYNDAHITIQADQKVDIVIGGQYYCRAKDGSILERDPNVLIVRLADQLEDDSTDDFIELLFPKPSATEDIKLELSSDGVNDASMILNNSTLAVSASGPVELVYNEQAQTVDLAAAEPTDISLMVTQNDTSSTWPWHSWALDTTGTTTLHAELDDDGLHLSGDGLTNAEYATRNESTEQVDNGTIPTQPDEATGITTVTIINKGDTSGDDKTEIITPSKPDEPDKPTPDPDPTPNPDPVPTPTPNPEPTPNPTPSTPTTPTTTTSSSGGSGGGGAALILGAGAVALTAGLVMTAPVAVQGKVEFADHTAVPGAKIALLQNGSIVAQTTADESGAFSLKVKRGNYELTAAYTDAAGQLHHQTLSIKAPAKDLTITF